MNTGYSKIVKEQHIRFVLRQDNLSFTGIGFEMAEKLPLLQMKKPVDVVFKIDENEWNGEKSLQLRVIDLRLSESFRLSMKLAWKYISHFWYVATNWNIWMAFFMVYDNVRGSLKYGTNTFIPVELKDLTITNGDRKKASRYEAVSFYMLEKLLNAFQKVSG